MNNYLSLVKFSHTIFALPFAMLGFFLATTATGQTISWKIFGLVILCMVFARSAAMAFNRYLDRDIDGKNPRTQTREIPAGVISPNAALAFIIFNCVAFIATTYFINSLCFYLSPVALLVILGYSATKRFTYLCHFVLGIGLALAPIGAYIAVTGKFDIIPILYSFAVLFWVAGFDIIYALQDEEFDSNLDLKSIPVKLGKKNALKLSSFLHVLSAMFIIGGSYMLSQHFPSVENLHWLAALIFVGLLFYQHRLVKPHDLSRVNLAFFTTNGIASVIFGTLVIIDLLF